MPSIQREPLRKQVRRLLVNQLRRNHLAPGSKLNESDLSEELNVSRTPLREALLILTFEGFLESEPGKGFKVRPLSKQEVLELFPVGRALETLALDSGGMPSTEQIRKLNHFDLQRKEHLATDVDPDVLVSLDNRWHHKLVERCENSELLNLLGSVRSRLYRYHRAFSAQMNLVRDAIEGHQKVVRALEDGDLDAAIHHLQAHWDNGKLMVANMVECIESNRTS